METPLCGVLYVVVVVCAARRGPERQIVLQVFGCFMFGSAVAP
jgi:hypothetical protein